MELSLLFSIISLFLSIFSLTIIGFMIRYSLDAKIEVEAMRKSTHTVQYIDPLVEKANKEYEEKKAKLEQAFKEAEEPRSSDDFIGF